MTTTDYGLPDPDLHADFYADVPFKRLLAWVLDFFAITALTIVVLPFTAFVGLFFLIPLWLTVSFAYRVVTLANWSATPGMWLMAIEFREHTGARFGLATAAMHTLIYSVAIGMFFPQVVSIILMLTTPRRQGLSDLALGTAAINRPAEF